MPSKKKPIRVFYSALGERFYATQHWKEDKPGVFVITGEKYDVTNDIGYAVERWGITFHTAKEEASDECDA